MHKAVLIWKETFSTHALFREGSGESVYQMNIMGNNKADRRMHKALLNRSNAQLATAIDSQGCLWERGVECGYYIHTIHWQSYMYR